MSSDGLFMHDLERMEQTGLFNDIPLVPKTAMERAEKSYVDQKNAFGEVTPEKIKAQKLKEEEEVLSRRGKASSMLLQPATPPPNTLSASSTLMGM